MHWALFGQLSIQKNVKVNDVTSKDVTSKWYHCKERQGPFKRKVDKQMKKNVQKKQKLKQKMEWFIDTKGGSLHLNWAMTYSYLKL